MYLQNGTSTLYLDESSMNCLFKNIVIRKKISKRRNIYVKNGVVNYKILATFINITLIILYQ